MAVETVRGLEAFYMTDDAVILDNRVSGTTRRRVAAGSDVSSDFATLSCVRPDVVVRLTEEFAVFAVYTAMS